MISGDNSRIDGVRCSSPSSRTTTTLYRGSTSPYGRKRYLSQISTSFMWMRIQI